MTIAIVCTIRCGFAKEGQSFIEGRNIGIERCPQCGMGGLESISGKKADDALFDAELHRGLGE